MEYQWHDLVGNLGVVAVLVTYALVQSERMDMRGLPYSLLNALGAVLICCSLVYDFNLSSFVIELVWFTISCYGLLRIWRAARSQPSVGSR